MHTVVDCNECLQVARSSLELDLTINTTRVRFYVIKNTLDIRAALSINSRCQEMSDSFVKVSLFVCSLLVIHRLLTKLSDIVLVRI